MVYHKDKDKVLCFLRARVAISVRGLILFHNVGLQIYDFFRGVWNVVIYNALQRCVKFLQVICRFSLQFCG